MLGHDVHADSDVDCPEQACKTASIVPAKAPPPITQGSLTAPEHRTPLRTARSRLRVALIGPAYPYRGGIAHHTTLLATHLRRAHHQVDAITFTRQYPALLYPGRSQEEPDATDVRPDVLPERMIDSVNPFNWLRVGKEMRRRNYDLHIFKFWLPFFGPAFGTIARLVRMNGRHNVLVICENLIPHERRAGDFTLTRYFLRSCDLAVTQSCAVQADLKRLFPCLPHAVLPHPTYVQFGSTIPKAEARSRLKLRMPKVLLFFGFVRHYKGLDRLLVAMPEIIRRVPDAMLVVVGEFLEDPKPYLALVGTNGLKDRVLFHSQYVRNEDVRLWFSAADILVMPYRSASNSGILQVAYNFGTPVIATGVGGLGETARDGKTGFVVNDASPSTLADAVERMYSKDTLERFASGIKEERGRYTWEAFVRGIEDLYWSYTDRNGARLGGPDKT